MKKKSLKKLLTAAGMTMCLTVIAKVPVWADCVTMTIERFTLGGGFLMEPTVVEFQPGEDYSDILLRVFQEKGYQAQHNNSSGSFYLEGFSGSGVDCGCNPPEIVQNIKNEIVAANPDLDIYTTNRQPGGLYQFSYGPSSGWMYSVNNDYPSIGMSGTDAKNGDVFRLSYTLVGTGADLTGMDRYSGNKQYYQPADKTALIRLMSNVNQAGKSNLPAYQQAKQVVETLDAQAYEVSGVIQALEAASGISSSTMPSVPTIPTPAATSTPTVTPTPTDTPSPTVSPSVTPSPTPTPTGTPTVKDEKTLFEEGKPSLSASPASETSVTVTWEAYQNADSYIVSRQEVGILGWTQLTETTELTYTDTTAQTGANYRYTVKAVSNKWGEAVNSDFRRDLVVQMPGNTATDAVGNATLTNVQSAGYNKLKLTWGKADKADGYEITRAVSQNGNYTLIKTIADASTTTYIDSGLTTGKNYYYKVRAYRTVDNKKIIGNDSAAKAAKPALSKPTLKVTAGSKKAVLKWSKVSGANGYIVYSATSKNGKYKAVKTVKKASTLNFTQKKLKKSKNYYYKVRAYRTVNGKKVTSADSQIQSAKIK